MNVLDHGEVLLIDHMAGDHKVCGAARISTGKRPEDASKGELADRKLIAFLMANGHGTPFEHAVFQFFIKAPIFVVREWQRHRMASYNEFSLRYAEVTEERAQFYVPDHARGPDPNNKQSTAALPGKAATVLVQQEIYYATADAMVRYLRMLSSGIGREMARMVLPVNLYTQFWFTVNARSLMNFLELRNSEAAQYEIRVYAEALEGMFAELMPWTYAAFVDVGRRAP